MSIFPFKTALNTSTLLPFRLSVEAQIEVAAEAGYDGIELWLDDVKKYLADGGSSDDLRELLIEKKLEFVNTIAFFKWGDQSAAVKKEALRSLAADMQLLHQLGCKGIAVPPFGDMQGVTLDQLADDFAKVAVLGREMGVEPYVEFWGKSPILSRLSEAVYVLLESNAADGKILLDPFHMYTGRSSIEGLNMLKGEQIGIFHVNDYPDSPSRDVIDDSFRVFPGEGKAPSHFIAQTLHQNGYQGYLSLELFQDNYGDKTALEVAQYGLHTVRQAYAIKPE
ncbi:sugar phosphate isomerase/epimerase family protein [Gracilibacillus alcaliphilus]|uniref:sugar phosphate isomerase/epimerase family protein n=1 Tax=Gracilibacillus alcaliphilus TaxID=1401441 RepID=UPI0019563C03|nr:sugar phosphate isomerase/epimerase family protein [Gracilibacillus alcaliphilus]MBM7675633.1 sugar phosphate isomerase/epimerase [Gracilibacillus alcaliphilus]